MPPISNHERALAAEMSKQVVARILVAANDEATVERMMETWGNAIDRQIGRGIRRFVWYVAIALIGLASAKLGLLSKIGEFFK